MVLSSDKISGLRRPLVQLKLDTISGGSVKESLVEMDSKELKLLLSNLKAAQAVSSSIFDGSLLLRMLNLGC